MRSLSYFFLIILSFSLIYPVGRTTSFSDCTTFYHISGELCYDYFTDAFVGSYTVKGQMKVVLSPLTLQTVAYESWHYLINPITEVVLVNEVETGILLNRMKSDGNYTPFFIDLPSSATQMLHTLTETDRAQYLGERYVLIEGHYIRVHYYCFTRADMFSIYRCEWFFEWDSGVLLRLYKSIEVNFLRVQWIEYIVENTTLNLSGSHPIVAFFTNFQEHFFALIGAIVIVVCAFYYLIQKKMRRTELP